MGGGARSELWRQMQADIFGGDVVTVNAEEGPAFGAAILAGVGAGLDDTVEEATDQLVSVKSRIEPDKDSVLQYEDYYEIFKSMYPALKPSFDALGAI